VFCKPYLHPAAAGSTSFTPDQIAALYGFPRIPKGPEQTIAIGELGGGYDTTDIQNYFARLKLPAPQITDVSVRGAKNNPGVQPDADGEVMLDILVAAAAWSWSTGQPANLLLVFAPNDGDGMADAVSAAVAHASRPSVFSWSWGGPEDRWPVASIQKMEAALQAAVQAGMTVTAAAGDNGSSDGERGNHVDYPASSSSVLSCGGTNLQVSGSRIIQETSWNNGSGRGATGGGFSALFKRPAWQDNFVPGNSRGVPDVAGDADPQSGYQIVVNGQAQVIGGTSAVAPLWAALVAVFNRAMNKRLGLIQPLLYQAEPSFRDVASGNNGAFSALVGWDACTGLGSPDGAKILAQLSGGAPEKPTVPVPQQAVQAAADAGILHGLQATLTRFGRYPAAPATVLNAALPLVTAAVNAEIQQVFQA